MALCLTPTPYTNSLACELLLANLQAHLACLRVATWQLHLPCRGSGLELERGNKPVGSRHLVTRHTVVCKANVRHCVHNSNEDLASFSMN